MANYNSVHSGQEIDAAVSAVQEKEDNWDGKAEQADLSAHTADKDNPHEVDPEQIGAIPATQKGAAGGVAELDSTGKVPSDQLPEMDYLPKAGGTMTGDINMGSHRITNLPKPTADADPLRRVDGLAAAVAALFGKDGNAVPNDIFNLLSAAALYKESPSSGLYDVLGNLLLTLPGVQIETGSYVGTGTYGSSNPNSLTFGFEPKLVILNGYFGSSNASNTQTNTTIVISEGTTSQTFCCYKSSRTVSSAWISFTIYPNFSGNTVSFYGDDAYGQGNVSERVYTYTALG